MERGGQRESCYLSLPGSTSKITGGTEDDQIEPPGTEWDRERNLISSSSILAAVCYSDFFLLALVWHQAEILTRSSWHLN